MTAKIKQKYKIKQEKPQLTFLRLARLRENTGASTLDTLVPSLKLVSFFVLLWPRCREVHTLISLERARVSAEDPSEGKTAVRPQGSGRAPTL